MSHLTQSPVALVTGAARGIGLATARRFLAEGWRVVLLDIDTETLMQAQADIGRPEDVLSIACDVADVRAVQAAILQVASHFSRLDALVNNAGVAVLVIPPGINGVQK